MAIAVDNERAGRVMSLSVSGAELGRHRAGLQTLALIGWARTVVAVLDGRAGAMIYALSPGTRGHLA